MDPVAALTATDDQDANEWAGTALVINTAAGSTPDGRLLIGLRLSGADLTATYLASYTPVLNDRVTYLKKGASLLVLGAPATA